MQVTLTIPKDDLTQEVFSFWVSDTKLFLDTYSLQKRGTKYKKFVAEKYYSRLSGRDSNLTENEVPFTEEIKKQAIDRFVSQLTCLKWSER